jgi:hypothetical protein
MLPAAAVLTNRSSASSILLAGFMHKLVGFVAVGWMSVTVTDVKAMVLLSQ